MDTAFSKICQRKGVRVDSPEEVRTQSAALVLYARCTFVNRSGRSLKQLYPVRIPLVLQRAGEVFLHLLMCIVLYAASCVVCAREPPVCVSKHMQVIKLS